VSFHIEAIGFDIGEVDLRIESLNAKHEAADEPAPVRASR